MTDSVAAPLPKGKCPHVLIAELQAEVAEKSQQLTTLREAVEKALEEMKPITAIGWQILTDNMAALAATAPAAREGEV